MHLFRISLAAAVLFVALGCKKEEKIETKPVAPADAAPRVAPTPPPPPPPPAAVDAGAAAAPGAAPAPGAPGAPPAAVDAGKK